MSCCVGANTSKLLLPTGKLSTEQPVQKLERMEVWLKSQRKQEYWGLEFILRGRFIPGKSWGDSVPALFSSDPGLHFFSSSENLPQVLPPPKTPMLLSIKYCGNCITAPVLTGFRLPDTGGHRWVRPQQWKLFAARGEK